MAEPSYKRARRPDSNQMWEESDRRAPLLSRERDEPPRERRDDRDRRGNGDRDRDRRYRSRSPRERDSRGGGRARDSDRGGRDSRDMKREGGRGRDDRTGGRDREREGGRDRENRDGGRGKPRERSRSRDKERRRSKSPRRYREEEREPEPRREEKAKSVPRVEEFTKSRTATPPVSFKVGAQDHDRMEMDEHKHLNIKGRGKKGKTEKEPLEEDDEIVIEDDGMAAMQAMMGFGGFETTHQKKVAGNDISAVRKEKKTEYRQYMNRVGGFNRPLSPTRET